MTRRILATLAAAFLAAPACHVTHRTMDEDTARRFDGMGAHHRPIATASEEAQAFFDQGLVWAYAFNHDEAIRSFERAAQLDPNCAMAYWGIALCHGPHINNPVMPPERSKAAWKALQQALARRDRARPVEQGLIDALAARYSEHPPADRRALDEAYAAAMQRVHEAHPGDTDVSTLYAESLMDLQPWDLWTIDGRAKGRTNEIVQVLEDVLAADRLHPGANHLYIHAVEASPHAEKGNAAAEVLRTAVPASGHLMHMPSHIDVQTGRWAMASDQNERAIEAERRYRMVRPTRGFYAVYQAHNHHFLAFTAMMEGRSAVALAAAREMIAQVPPDFLREQPQFIDPYMMIALDVLKRFGRWDEILREPPPAGKLPITRAFRHFIRGLAFAAKGELDAAESERRSFREAVGRVPKDAVMAINPAHKVLSIAEHMLAGEISLRRGAIDEAVRELREAVRLEDTLLYMEPPEWIQPVRHTLGAVLVHAKRYAEAEAVYREDLKNWPENGWSLFGLAQAVRAQGKTSEADAVQGRFEMAWRRADVKIATTCACVTHP
ncbi:MAG: tetratricopeptide repeat protein [Phycisphaerae bacterium]|nr:tetratricopeptide repeat protein [Phycisphaerae bacterium]